MRPADRREFLRELDATDEAYVREKFALGGYTGWQVAVVKYWTEKCESRRQEERATHQLVLARQSAFWTKTRVVVAIVGTTVAALIQWFATR